jgi:hypothetical protein
MHTALPVSSAADLLDYRRAFMSRIKYDSRTIRERRKDPMLLEAATIFARLGVVKPYIWGPLELTTWQYGRDESNAVPISNEVALHALLIQVRPGAGRCSWTLSTRAEIAELTTMRRRTPANRRLQKRSDRTIGQRSPWAAYDYAKTFGRDLPSGKNRDVEEITKTAYQRRSFKQHAALSCFRGTVVCKWRSLGGAATA